MEQSKSIRKKIDYLYFHIDNKDKLTSAFRKMISHEIISYLIVCNPAVIDKNIEKISEHLKLISLELISIEKTLEANFAIYNREVTNRLRENLSTLVAEVSEIYYSNLEFENLPYGQLDLGDGSIFIKAKPTFDKKMLKKIIYSDLREVIDEVLIGHNVADIVDTSLGQILACSPALAPIVPKSYDSLKKLLQDL